MQCRTDSILEFRKFLYLMKCFYKGRQCKFEIADADKGGQKLLLANYCDPFPVTIFAASVNVNSKSQVETNEGHSGSGSPSAAHCDADPARMIDKSTHPALPHNKSITNTPTA